AAFMDQRLSRVPGVKSAKIAHVLSEPKHHRDWIPPDPTRPRILVVDDDPDFVEVTRLVLEAERFDVRSAASGAEALTSMLAAPPDLVILDVMMDGVLDGWDASGRIRANPRLRQTPILVVSSITSSDYIGLLPTDEDHLIDNFISKPVPPGKLLAEVKRLLRRSG
ncbi:MAG: response regulator, partial [Chloroflexota bacterium]